MTYRPIAILIVAVACTSTAGSRTVPTSSANPAGSPTSSTAQPIGEPPSGAAIDLSSLEGRIVFSSETEDVWVANADGSNAHRLTSTKAWEFDPTWSPDGARIAFRYQPGDDDTTEIYAIDSDGTDVVRLTRNDVPDWGPDWSPDGRRIVWNSAVRTGGFGFFGTTMRPDGSGVRLVSRHYVEYPTWSPDGTKIAFMAQLAGASGNDPDYEIFVMDADGSHVRRLTRNPGSDGWPAWSPDGTQIVYASTVDDCSNSDAPDCRTTGDIGPWHDVWVMDADGTHQRRVTPEFGQFFAWSPDGRAIMVAGASSLYVVRPDGSGKVDIRIDGVPHPLFPDWIG
jgi:Tol biopolymer transport system component